MPKRPDGQRGVISETVDLVDAAGLVSELSTSRIVVVALDVRRFDPLPPTLHDALSDGDRAAAARFRFPADRQRFRLGRGMVRHLVSAAVGMPAAELPLVAADHGKPCLADAQAAVHFNVSHSGDLVLVAFGNLPVGVDIEMQRADIDLAAIAGTCFSAAERSDIFLAPADAQAKFFRYWTCKEAWIKADGRGLSLPLVEFTVTGLDGGDCRVQRGGIALPWRVRPLVVREGYEAALASTDAPWSVGLYTVT
jgi:4'-phosphopantetheinyl transferase